MLTFFRWSGILIGGFQCFHHVKEKHSVLPCGTPRLRENLDTALPLAADPKKTLALNKQMRLCNSLCGLPLRSAVVCLRQLLGVVGTIQARRRGRATLFGNTRRGAPRSLFRVAVACRCATKSKLNPNWEEMPNSPFEPLLLQGA